MPVSLKAERRAAGLDWPAFSAHYFPSAGFPHGRRHDFDAALAYAAYKQLPEQASGRNETFEAMAAWEGEGGSALLSESG